MKVTTSIQRGAEYLYTKLGAVVTAVQQVAVVKGLAMWEVDLAVLGLLVVPAQKVGN